MGIVIRQSIWNAVWSYIGIAIGAVNTMFLFTAFLSTEQYGLLRIIFAIATLANQIFSLGIVNLTLKFFPFFKNEKGGDNGFLKIALLVPLLGYFLFFISAVLLKTPLINFYSNQSNLFESNYFQVFVLTFLIIYFNVFDGYLRANKKTVFPTVLKNVVLRLLLMLAVILFYFKVYDFEKFVHIYVWSNGIILLLEILYTKYRGLFHWSKFNAELVPRKEMITFGGFAIMGASMSYMANYLDVLMVGGITEKGLSDAAVYSVATYMGTLILVPYHSVVRISTTFISDAWKKNDINEIQKIYQRSSSNLMFVGVLVYLGIVLNLDNIFSLLPDEYEGGKMVIVLIGAAKLIDAATSLNGIIMQYSNYFKYLLIFNGAFIGLVFVSNLIFIPMYGLNGAAMATLLSLFSTNLIKSVFLYVKFKLIPFDNRVFKILALGSGIFMFYYFIPIIDNWVVNTTIRVIPVVLIYLILSYKLKLSDELVRIVHKRIK